MSALREEFEKLFAEWAAKRGLPETVADSDENSERSFVLGDAVATLAYRDETDTVILWFECGFVESPTCFRGLLRANDRYANTRGFTLAYAPRAGRVILHDRRPAERIDSVETLDSWLWAGSAVASAVYELAHVGLKVAPKDV